MIKQSVLPAALMLLANSGAMLPVSATSVAAARETNAASALPIAASFTATNEAREPARLQDFVGDLVKRAASPSMEAEPWPWGRCGTISGSGGGWDDSRQDC
jgi:hypothetical protein